MPEHCDQRAFFAENGASSRRTGQLRGHLGLKCKCEDSGKERVNAQRQSQQQREATYFCHVATPPAYFFRNASARQPRGLFIAALDASGPRSPKQPAE